jgi:ParB family chromosome partitioning protein
MTTPKVNEYKDIPLENLTIGLFQTRNRGADKDISELADSIRAVGLLEPIIVAPEEEGKYQIVAGQRRYQACKELGEETIRAGILSQKPETHIGKALSLTENLLRRDMDQKDYIDACTSLHRQYGNAKHVSEELGLPYNKVCQYVKYDRLVQKLKEKVDGDGLDMKVALKAQNAATNSEKVVDEEKAVAFAEEMKSLLTSQRDMMVKIAKHEPNASAEEIIERGRKPPQEKKMTITFATGLYNSLEKFADEEKNTPSEAAVELIHMGLIDKGYAE